MDEIPRVRDPEGAGRRMYSRANTWEGENWARCSVSGVAGVFAREIEAGLMQATA